jgi:hypothetical protein
MQLYKDALKFADLSSKYRKAVKHRLKESNSIMKEIKELISFSAERIGRVFRVQLVRESGCIDKGVGVPMVALSINEYANRNGMMKKRDFTTFNPKKEKSLHGINMIMDYSGSMWFGQANYRDHRIGGKLRRIYAQNFLALTLGVYLQRLSKGQLKVAYTIFSEHPITQVMTDVINADWDSYIVHWRWGSHGHDGCSSQTLFVENNDLMPTALRTVNGGDWFCNVYPREAFIESKAVFNNLKLKDFVNIVFTDGGMHRLGESKADRVRFLSKALKTVAESELSFSFILSQQEDDFTDILKELSIKHSVVNSVKEYNDSFSYLFHLINEMKGV